MKDKETELQQLLLSNIPGSGNYSPASSQKVVPMHSKHLGEPVKVLSLKNSYIWEEPGRTWKGQQNGNFTLYLLGFLDHLHFSCLAGNYHMS